MIPSTTASSSNPSTSPTAVSTPATSGSPCKNIRRMASTRNTTRGSAKTIPIKPRPMRNRNRLLASFTNLLHGSATSALSSATQCRNMNFPRLLNHNTSSHSATPSSTKMIVNGTIQPRFTIR